MNTLGIQFAAARKAGVPIVGISSYDPEAMISGLQRDLVASEPEEVPMIQWDCISGWRSRNDKGTAEIERITADIGLEATIPLTETLELAKQLPEGSILFLLNVHNYFDQPNFVQATWNIRDEFKIDFRTLVMVAPYLTLPDDIKHDVIVFDEELPDELQLREIVDNTVAPVLAAHRDIIVTEETKLKAVDALRGIPAFPAEQTTAMAISRAGLDVDMMWDRKRRMINDTPGLKVYTGTERFDDIGGCEAIKSYLRGVINGREAPRGIVFIDEGEKMFAGATHDVGDNTGVAQDALATKLSFMEDNECSGTLFVGPPGTAKSAIGKAMGNEAGSPTIMLDLGAVKGSLVGESERKLREAFKIIHAVCGGRVYFIMTCNKDVALPPELKRRYTDGTWMFDLPTDEEQATIWPRYTTRYEIDPKGIKGIDFRGWTGAEIRNVCRLAYRQRIPLAEAAKFIIPVADSAKEQIEKLREAASGKYLSAATPGRYIHVAQKPSYKDALKPKGRGVKIEGEDHV
jgi:ATPase family associated with various cellular activities (AAA)